MEREYKEKDRLPVDYWHPSLADFPIAKQNGGKRQGKSNSERQGIPIPLGGFEEVIEDFSGSADPEQYASEPGNIGIIEVEYVPLRGRNPYKKFSGKQTTTQVLFENPKHFKPILEAGRPKQQYSIFAIDVMHKGTEPKNHNPPPRNTVSKARKSASA